MKRISKKQLGIVSVVVLAVFVLSVTMGCLEAPKTEETQQSAPVIEDPRGAVSLVALDLSQSDVGKTFELGEPGGRFLLTIESVDVLTITKTWREEYSFFVRGFEMRISEGRRHYGVTYVYIILRVTGIDNAPPINIERLAFGRYTSLGEERCVDSSDFVSGIIKEDAESIPKEAEYSSFRSAYVVKSIPVEEGVTYRVMLGKGCLERAKVGRLEPSRFSPEKRIPKLTLFQVKS